MLSGLFGARDNARSNVWSELVVVWSASSVRSIDGVAVLVESKAERREEEEERRRITHKLLCWSLDNVLGSISAATSLSLLKIAIWYSMLRKGV